MRERERKKKNLCARSADGKQTFPVPKFLVSLVCTQRGMAGTSACSFSLQFAFCSVCGEPFSSRGFSQNIPAYPATQTSTASFSLTDNRNDIGRSSCTNKQTNKSLMELTTSYYQGLTSAYLVVSLSPVNPEGLYQG